MRAPGNWASPRRNTAVAGLVMLASVMVAAPAAWTAILDVPGTHPSLAAAAAACAAGDTINITSSYTDTGGTATMTGGTPIRNSVTIQGNGHTVTCGAGTWTNGVIRFKNVTGGVVQNLNIDGAELGANLLFVDGTAGGAQRRSPPPTAPSPVQPATASVPAIPGEAVGPPWSPPAAGHTPIWDTVSQFRQTRPRPFCFACLKTMRRRASPRRTPRAP